jgi:hypothetical protein
MTARDAPEAAYLRGFLDAKQGQEPDCLRRVLADGITRARVRKALQISDPLLNLVAAGKVQLSKANWAKLAKALGNPDLWVKPIMSGELVYTALSRLKGWVPASEVAEQAGLPLPVVRLALRELAAADRAKRDVVGRWGKDKLEERWLAAGVHEPFPVELRSSSIQGLTRWDLLYGERRAGGRRAALF